MKKLLFSSVMFICTAVFATEAAPPSCPGSLIDALAKAKIIGDPSSIIGGISTSPSLIYAGAGVGHALTGAMTAAAGNFLLALVPKPVHIAKIDHLVLILGKDQAGSLEDAKEKMSSDFAESIRVAVGADSTDKPDNSNAALALKGGYCAPGRCLVNSVSFRFAKSMPEINTDGDFVIISNLGVEKNGVGFFGQNLPMIMGLLDRLGERGYQAGFWQAESQSLLTTTAICRGRTD